MKKLIIFLSIWLLLYLFGFVNQRKSNDDFDFMSRSHTNICRAIAAIFILFQHAAGGFGLRYLTPFGGIGVAIFTILSGYGLNESFKQKGFGGGIGNIRLLGF